MMKIILLILILTVLQIPSVGQVPVEIDLCKLVAEPSEYNGKVLTIKGILYPGDHSLALYSPVCAPREGSDVSTQAVLPEDWRSLSIGRRLSSFLKNRRPAQITATGLFESKGVRYGPDIARFRFTINAISSVEPTPKDHPDR